MYPIQNTAVETAKNSIEQISLVNPILALLLIVLFVIVVALAWVVIKQNKTLNEKNEKLYEDAKADLALTIAFGDEIRDNTNKIVILEKVLFETNANINNIKNLIEIALKIK